MQPSDGPATATLATRLERVAVDPRALAAAAAVIACLAVAGAIVGDEPADAAARRLLWLDGERGLPALVSAALLVAAGATAALVAIRRRAAARSSWWAWGLAVLLPLLACDEALEIHERLSDRVGVGWVQLYTPLAVLAGVAWLAALRASPARGVRAALIGGASCWLLATTLEYLEWPEEGGRADGYVAMMVVEEPVEMLGSLLFWAAFAAWLRRL